MLVPTSKAQVLTIVPIIFPLFIFYLKILLNQLSLELKDEDDCVELEV
ncbi:hypothetical protein C5L18_001365 [Lactobacillus amylolyticus]|uniref:Uncharacterized protein n=1 Tax=Lactobacillus amylolyticus DSM 11664 TaxID=585524 RepID=D4YVW0_9LACO|nr:hypothetical protein [Lactobacillus amylolyticus]EFG54693.1 hypothetical protein HMPREF0493_1671 [Lactobacillus amylolyticus DSM 11664]TDG61928.1 hypothetical protein C5L18_001365 [Lactobacillus amylolyticus]